jgi:cytochrome c peroxidase
MCTIVLWLSGGALSVGGGSALAAVKEDGASLLRSYIGRQVGGIETLTVPAADADIPQPRLADGTPDPQFKTTEAKRYLGKQLFHDPVRTARILPDFGGIPATAQTASCGSCHFGEAASKSGTLLNFAVGGEGRGYTDAAGNFIPRRRPRLDLLPKLRETPLFPGDSLVDELPTLTDVYANAVGSPARGRKLPDPGPLLRTGRLDALDSVARNAPSVLGAAFNNRLLMGGFAGEPDSSPGGLNPFNFVAQESVALLLLDAHRMLDFQSAKLQAIPVYRKLFRDAFPEEAAQAPACLPQTPPAAGACDALINDITVLRATATFMRTVVTRNTPWDRFLAGDDRALTPAQQRGARLFFTKAEDRGAGCFGCHSGPMLNKQVNDPDVRGMGQLVEENFHNLGLADHPLQALNRLAYNNPAFRDDGRREITGRAEDAFKFRTLTLRQLKDARLFFHNGAFTTVKDVVRYFNTGIPQDTTAGAASTLSSRFTNPRGPGSAPGLGLADPQVDDLADFLENALYDPAFVRYDPSSPTPMFQLTPRDFMYSVYRPDLKALGAVDGRPASGLPQDNDDPLSRRDMGIEFLDVTSQAQITIRSGSGGGNPHQNDVVRITNNGTSVIDTHLLVIVQGLDKRLRLANASGSTAAGEPYLRVFVPRGELPPGQSLVETLRFAPAAAKPSAPPRASYTLRLLSGQGNP